MYKIIFKKLLQQNSHSTCIAKSGPKFRCTMMTSGRYGYLKSFTTISATTGRSWLSLLHYWHLFSVLYRLATLPTPPISLNTEILLWLFSLLFPNKSTLGVLHPSRFFTEPHRSFVVLGFILGPSHSSLFAFLFLVCMESIR